MKKLFDIDDFYACNGVINGADIVNGRNEREKNKVL